jgi:hypothetical protein
LFVCIVLAWGTQMDSVNGPESRGLISSRTVREPSSTSPEGPLGASPRARARLRTYQHHLALLPNSEMGERMGKLTDPPAP